MKKVLVLGGTHEAVEIAENLGRDHQVVYALAGKTDAPNLPDGCTIRIGGFGGYEGMVLHLRQQRYGRVVDATHPFARVISAHAQQACQCCGIPYDVFVRKPWQPRAGDQWREIRNWAELIDTLDQEFSTALITLGQRHLDAFAALRHTRGIFRMITPPVVPHFLLSDTCRHTILCQRPPYEFDFECALIENYACDCLVTRNSGGERPAKLEAFARAGYPVLMLQDVVAPTPRQTPTPTPTHTHTHTHTQAQTVQEFLETFHDREHSST